VRREVSNSRRARTLLLQPLPPFQRVRASSGLTPGHSPACWLSSQRRPQLAELCHAYLQAGTGKQEGCHVDTQKRQIAHLSHTCLDCGGRVDRPALPPPVLLPPPMQPSLFGMQHL